MAFRKLQALCPLCISLCPLCLSPAPVKIYRKALAKWLFWKPYFFVFFVKSFVFFVVKSLHRSNSQKTTNYQLQTTNAPCQPS